MTIRTCSAKTIPVLWLSVAAAWLAPAAAPPKRAASAGTGGLTALARAWRESPTPARGAALEAFAKAHAAETAGALARLALGITAYEQKDYAAALEHLKGLSARLPQIADYVAYYQAAARVEAATELEDVGRGLAPIHRSAASADTSAAAPSPLAGRAWLLEARALKLSQPAEAVRLLREHYSELPQPEGDINLADCYQAAGDLPHAADFYQRVYFQRISGDAAARATAALLTLKDSLGAAYPQPLPEQMLRRADLLLEARQYPEARTEYETLVGQLVGLERDQARVRLGAADFLRGDTAAASQYLRGLEMAGSEADAERLFYLEECARRLNDEDAMMAAVKRLGNLYPNSPWRLRALVGAANHYLVTNRTEELAPLDKAIWEDFPNQPSAAQSHWRIAFRAYLEDKSDAPDLLREHLEKFPAHATAGAALYFLGRGAEREKALAEASAFYNQLAKALPNTYYAMLARERMTGAEWKTVTPAPQVQEFLAKLRLPTAKPVPLETTAATTVRIERSRLLRTAGLADLADAELRFGARTDGQPSLLAMEMATSADAPYQGLRAMKSLNSNYLDLPLGGAPEKFWKLLFPMPYREELIASANAVDLDPYLVAGLIRQESEFNPEAISRANAYGLTQVRPVTGREFARRAGVPHFTSRVLFEPSVNLKIGAAIFRSMLDKNNGSLVETLAAYNAGPARAAQWISWGTYREPAEFVESIPFTETRDYVQSVLRNADIYRRLYK
jgi:soluble lytic murein transglycosylase